MDLERPVVSVIIPVYNYGRYLGEAVESLRGQSLREWECLIVDDCSTDNTEQVARQLEYLDRRVRYLQTPVNLGPNAARNIGLRVACGKYVQFLDADDLLQADKLRVQSEFLGAHDEVDLVYGPMDCFVNGQDRLNATRSSGSDAWMPCVSGSGKDVLRSLVYSNIMVVNSPLFRISLARNIGYCNESIRTVEDWDFWLRCALSGARFEYHKAHGDMALVRVHGASCSNNELSMLESTLSMRKSLAGCFADTELERLNLARLSCALYKTARLKFGRGDVLSGMRNLAEAFWILSNPAVLACAVKVHVLK